MLKMKKRSLNTKLLSYFLTFSILILFLLWTFQVLFLESFYKYQRTNEIKYIATEIKSLHSSDDFYNLIDKLSFDREVCIEIRSQESSIYDSVFFGKGCLRSGKDKQQYIDYFINSGIDEGTFNIKNTYTDIDTIFHGIKLSDNIYAFINASLDPMDSTSRILAKQLIIVSVVVLLLAFIASFFISSRLSKPIASLNKQTKRIAEGDFDYEFSDNSNILEISELTDTLNYTIRELSKTDELRRDLMANVSHDLKTPLTMIKAYAEMGRDLHADDLDKRNDDYNIIISEVDRLTLLVNDILDLSKMQAKTITPNYEEFDIIKLSNNILKKYSVYQETENYHFTFKHNIKSIVIHADKKMIEQVIYNLVNNAIHYTGEDKAILVVIHKTNNIIRFEVSDTGNGIKEEDIPHIWDRYYKNQKRHKRNLIGTGLGLSIVKNILEIHGYQYGVHTKLEHGTTFYFEIDMDK